VQGDPEALQDWDGVLGHCAGYAAGTSCVRTRRNGPFATGRTIRSTGVSADVFANVTEVEVARFLQGADSMAR
jgi:hypothetical protein